MAFLQDLPLPDQTKALVDNHTVTVQDALQKTAYVIACTVGIHIIPL